MSAPSSAPDHFAYFTFKSTYIDSFTDGYMPISSVSKLAKPTPACVTIFPIFTSSETPVAMRPPSLAPND